MPTYSDIEQAELLSRFMQDDSVQAIYYNKETGILYAVEPGTDKHLGGHGGRIKALEMVNGESIGRPAGCPPVFGPDIQLTGQITTIGPAVTGYGTAALSELVPGDRITGSSGQYRIVKNITGNETFELYSGFDSDITVQEDFYKQGTNARRIWHLGQSDSTTTYHAANKHLNIQGSGQLQHDGSAFAGNTDAGEFLHWKELTVNFNNGALTATVPHGVSGDAHDNQLIKIIAQSRYKSATGDTDWNILPNRTVSGHQYNNTNIIFQRASSTDAVTLYVTIGYIE